MGCNYIKFNKLLVVPADFRGFSPFLHQLCHMKDELHCCMQTFTGSLDLKWSSATTASLGLKNHLSGKKNFLDKAVQLLKQFFKMFQYFKLAL